MKRKVLFCIVAVIITTTSIMAYSNIRTQYQSNILKQTIKLPNGAYFIHEKDLVDSCEIYFFMLGNEADIVSKLSGSEAGFDLSSDCLYNFQEWIENDRGLYKKITLIYYKSNSEAD